MKHVIIALSLLTFAQVSTGASSTELKPAPAADSTVARLDTFNQQLLVIQQTWSVNNYDCRAAHRLPPLRLCWRKLRNSPETIHNAPKPGSGRVLYSRLSPVLKAG